MSTPASNRPVRRTRKKIVIDEEDEEITPTKSTPGVEEEEYTPAPTRSPQRRARKSTADVPATPRTATRRRRTMADEENVEPSEIFMPEGSVPPTPSSPTKRGSPRKRKSAAAPKSVRESTISEHVPQLPTPQPSASPEPPQLNAEPLADITNAAINEQSTMPSPDVMKEAVVPKLAEVVLEKPMDIVVRTRALGIPKTEEPTGPRSRTVIKYLILINFKSYAGRQEVGPFHASFSSVVGPNGSGKSNVIDSLLFVFGFRASKMRQGKISALIHNSAAYPDLDFCEVQVHFEEVMDLPGGKHEVVADSQLIISRKAFKNNTSKYYMNGRESNFTAVTTLLKERGVDLDHKRFLILQGEVESIAQMKPKAGNEHEDGLLEYLEDIIGTSKYKTPIEESAAEVETLNEVCVEKSARVQHVEKEKNSLEDKKNKAIAYIRDENELAFKEAALYQVYIHDCNDNLKVTEEAVVQMQAKLDDELGKHKGNEDDIKKLEKAYSKGQREYESLEKDTQIILKEMAKYEKEKVKFEEKKKFLLNKQKKLEKTLNSSRLAASEAKSSIQKFADDVERNSEEIASLEASMKAEAEELANIRESLKGKTQAFSDEIAVKQKQLEPWNEKISQKQSAIAVAQSELDILHEKASAGAVALEELQAKIEGYQKAQESKLEELETAKSEKINLEKAAKRVQQEIAKLAQKEPELRSKLSNSRQKADEARASLASTQSRGNVLNGLMRLKDSGRIEGFHGRLGNLGTIDQKYDIAISTACPSLDNLVVDSVEVGQQCIDYLRKNNLGRANFILLDRLARRDMSQLDTPENVPRLFDLVKPKDDMFKPAFYSVLQNTLVAKDLEQANRIAYGARRWRVVTLDGQLIDVSGTMSGGGTRVARGGMSSKLAAETTREQVEKLEVDRDALERQFQESQAQQRELDLQYKKLLTQIPEQETKMQKINLEIESLNRNIADSERRVIELRKESQPSKSDDVQIASLEKQIAQLEKEVTKLHSQTAGLSTEIKELQDKIMEVGGVRLRTQKAKVDGLKEQIDTLTEETSNAEVSKSKANKEKAKHEKAYEQAQKDIAASAHELEQLDDEANTQTADANDYKRKADEAQSALDDKKDELNEMKKELEEKTAQLNETRAVEIEMKNKLEENQKVFAENQKRLRYWSEKLGKLTLHSLSDLGDEHEQDATTLPQYTEDELADMSKDKLKAEIAVLEEKTQNVNVDLGVLDEYRRRVEEHTSRSTDLATAVSSRDMAKKRCDDLRRLRLEGFMEGFSLISLRLKEMYQMITMGGNAELELVDSLDPFSEGILFSVMPPKKSWKNISNLSGGEKTLSSLALVFALHHYKPTPLYVMDEIDAALDFRNVRFSFS
jgi:structural maintenance of chromosome 4